MKPILFLLIILLCVCEYTNAQLTGKTYAETKREQANNQYNKDFIEGTRYNRNRSSTGNGSSSSNDEARKLADQFKRNKGQMTETDKEYWRLKQQAKQNAEEQRQAYDKSYHDFRKAEAARMKYVRELERIKVQVEEARAKVRTTMLESGLTSPEAYNLAWFMIPGTIERTADVQRFIADKMLWVPESFILFAQSRDVEDYERLNKLADGFVYAGYSHVKAQQYLAIRFPDKEKETSLGMLKGMQNFYGGSFEVNTKAQYDNSTWQMKREMEELFLDLYEKYPVEALEACVSYPGYSPVKDLFRTEDNQENKIILAEMGIRIPDYTRAGAQLKMQYFNYLQTLPGYFEAKSAAYWQEIGKSWEGGAAEIIAALSGSDDHFNNISFKKGKLDRIEVTESLKKEWLPYLQKLADAGNASALNALGVLAVSGNLRKKNKEDAVIFWQKAATAGSLFAHLNLLKANKTGFENLPEAAQLQKNFMDMISKATGEELLEMALAISANYHGDMTAEMNAIGKTLAEAALSMGVKKAALFIDIFD